MSIKSRVVCINQFGSPAELKIEEKEIDGPGPGEILVRHTVTGLNFIDIY